MVTVAPPVERTVAQYEYATGRVEPVEQVEIRARINGYLTAVHFQPGREIAKGQPLFEIDPEPKRPTWRGPRAWGTRARRNTTGSKS
jgi:multidrug efflux system membrane fusion protein